MISIIYPPPQPSHLWLSVLGWFFSTLIGALVAYTSNRYLKKQEIQDKAYTSAILIRNWLIEKTGQTVNLKRNLEKKLELANLIDLQKYATNYTSDDSINLITVMQKFKNDTNLYDLNFNLIENISLMREHFIEYENVLQSLSLVVSGYSWISEIKTNFNQIKDDVIKNIKENDHLAINQTNHFLIILKRQIPNWIEIITMAEIRFRNVFNIFQEKICKPLKIKPIKLEEPVLADDLIKQMTQNNPQKETFKT